MKCALSTNNFLPKSFNSSINDLYLTFPENKMFMKTQIKNQNFELVSKKKNVKNYFDLPFKPHQILLGSLLGDMFLRKEYKNSNIEETHSIAQRDYLIWKYKILSKFFDLKLYDLNNYICKVKRKTYNYKVQVRLRSKVSEKLNIYHDLFYLNGKKTIRKEILNQIDSLALAVWYCDDGSYDYQDKHVRLHTEGFSYKENLLLKDWLKNDWNIDSSFKKARTGQFGLKLDTKNSDKFLKLIKDHILEMPQCMWYKLGHLYQGNIHRLNEAKLKREIRMRKYRERDEIKERDRIRNLEYYYKNKESILKYKKEYNKSSKYKIYLKEYRNRPEVKERLKKYTKEYRKQPGYRKWVLEYQRQYRKRPEVKAKIKEYNRRAREKKKQGGKN